MMAHALEKSTVQRAGVLSLELRILSVMELKDRENCRKSSETIA